ncbi:Sigma-54-dependent Fis family transcriptional regulator [Gammaproteobacteria bacterium]
MYLLLDIWREVCRHIEIDEAISRTAPVLSRRFPVDLVMIRRFDPERSLIETVAASLCRPGTIPQQARTDCRPEDLERLSAWFRQGIVIHESVPKSASLLNILVPAEVTGSILAGPLVNEDGQVGILLMITRAPHHFLDEHVAIMQTLLEPFTVALENDRRFHELARLREAVEAENRALLSRLQRQEILESIVGADSGLRSVMGRVEQVAPTDAPVLILGETGSGKEVVARAIHSRSRRVGGPIVRVNCGAIPPELVDSELFGHERGSFTGAVSTRKGWFERADGGTLFLDEVAELPLAAQVRLLRILQDGSFERVGGQRTLTVDVRIVAATHRDMPAMVATGAFREDLWYRISVFPIRLPPLREHMEDLPALAAHFALRIGMRLGGSALAPTQDDIALLLGYQWPGNIRELATVIERAAILGDGRCLEIAGALGTNPRPTKHGPPLSHELSVFQARPSNSQDVAALDTAIVHHIEEVLTRTHGRIEGPYGAALLLGINPHTLRSRMRKLGIDWRRFRNRS